MWRLAAPPMVAGVKYAPGGIGQDTVALLADPPPEFAVLAGDDAFLMPMLALGAAGGVTANAHLCTRQFADLFAASRDGDIERMRALGNRLAVLAAALSGAPNPTVLKGVLHAAGRIPSAAVRLPLLPAPAETGAEAVAVAGRMGGCIT
jgi:4-hydroxy-tetrahydrodipicolinate synthase